MLVSHVQYPSCPHSYSSQMLLVGEFLTLSISHFRVSHVCFAPPAYLWEKIKLHKLVPLPLRGINIWWKRAIFGYICYFYTKKGIVDGKAKYLFTLVDVWNLLFIQNVSNFDYKCIWLSLSFKYPHWIEG